MNSYSNKTLSRSEVSLMRLARNATDHYQLNNHLVGWKFTRATMVDDLNFVPVFGEMVADRIENSWTWTGSTYSGKLRSRWIYLSFCTIRLIYGGLHLLAWNAPLHSKTESIMWRVSSLTIMLSGPALGL